MAKASRGHFALLAFYMSEKCALRGVKSVFPGLLNYVWIRRVGEARDPRRIDANRQVVSPSSTAIIEIDRDCCPPAAVWIVRGYIRNFE